MRSISSRDAQAHLYRLLDEVADGEPITITRRGRPVAQLVPIDRSTSKADDLLDRLRTLRKGNTLGGLPIRELIDEGRK
jgi:prevent-host-death family protein